MSTTPTGNGIMTVECSTDQVCRSVANRLPRIVHVINQVSTGCVPCRREYESHELMRRSLDYSGDTREYDPSMSLHEFVSFPSEPCFFDTTSCYTTHMLRTEAGSTFPSPSSQEQLELEGPEAAIRFELWGKFVYDLTESSNYDVTFSKPSHDTFQLKFTYSPCYCLHFVN